jgi:hypothetical protein
MLGPRKSKCIKKFKNIIKKGRGLFGRGPANENFPKLPNTRGTAEKHPGRWWVVGAAAGVGSHNTRRRSYGHMDRTATWNI